MIRKYNQRLKCVSDGMTHVLVFILSLLSTKRNLKDLFEFILPGGVKLLIAKIKLFQRFCLSIEHLVAVFCCKLDVVLNI